jgi:hypothetical protein
LDKFSVLSAQSVAVSELADPKQESNRASPMRLHTVRSQRWDAVNPARLRLEWDVDF